MAEPTALRLHDNQPFRKQLGHAAYPWKAQMNVCVYPASTTDNLCSTVGGGVPTRAGRLRIAKLSSLFKLLPFVDFPRLL
eukprot:scaffold115534_cov42-Attheya_sp.AAC.1